MEISPSLGINATHTPIHRSPRIGLMFEYGSLNGGEFSMLAAIDCFLTQHSDSIVFPIALCQSSGPLTTALEQRGMSCRIAPVDEKSSEWKLWLNSIIDEFDLQLLHANSLTMSRRLGAISSSLKCPATGHIRDIMKLSRSAVTALNQLSGLVAVSHATKDVHSQQGVHSSLLTTIHNGIETSQFATANPTGKLRSELGLPDDAFLVVTIGQICLRKGQTDLADAAVLLRDSIPNVNFLLVGQRHSTKRESIEFDETITQKFERAGMGDRLHRLEFRSDIPFILNEIDLLVHAARQEPLGRVLLEAAACGVPIVATDVGGTSEILEHRESGWLVPPAQPELLAEGILQLFNNATLAAQLGKNARDTILHRFTSQRAATELLAFWESVLYC